MPSSSAKEASQRNAGQVSLSDRQKSLGQKRFFDQRYKMHDIVASDERPSGTRKRGTETIFQEIAPGETHLTAHKRVTDARSLLKTTR